MTDETKSPIGVRWSEPADTTAYRCVGCYAEFSEPADTTAYRCVGCYAEFADPDAFDMKGLCPKCNRIVEPGAPDPTD